ncbi:uracil permease [Paenactinomyces guangxiensis]|uniref:Uracil permease n=2 Tax=Paenactinomyces guangxiensis TaxID=1490290 RepID=A0A7W2A773_9BACL|nr:uracil permease [Paenactinomyces guangxiensis]MBH8590717.1 uracil permease [Paenactinomyces guangxiensis]
MDVHERPKLWKWIALSFQHLFAMFGSTILVPVLTGLSPSVTLMASGIGTIAYLIVTRGKVPAYLGSSFAFIVPIITVSQGGKHIGEALFGCLLVGIMYGVVALFVYRFGVKWLDYILPPVVIGSVVIVIGLALAGTAVDMASMKDVVQQMPRSAAEWQHLDGSIKNVDTEHGKITMHVYSLENFGVALATLGISIIASLFFRGFLNIIPILIGIIGGYIVAYFTGMVDFTAVQQAKWFDLPQFTVPTPSWKAALVILPVILAVLAEHIGHLVVTGTIMDRDLTKDPGLHRSLLGDGIATSIAALLGGPPTTTYGENIGVMAITRIFSVWVIGGAAVLAIGLSCVGKLAALIQTIPTPVMGGVSILLFGIIASAGLRMLIENRIDFNDRRNLVIAAVVLVIGIGGAVLRFADIHLELEGMALATVVGIVLNLVLPKQKEEKETYARVGAA